MLRTNGRGQNLYESKSLYSLVLAGWEPVIQCGMRPYPTPFPKPLRVR